MAARRGADFDRRMEDALVTRLRSGEAPEALLHGLMSRLAEDDAVELLSRAKARAEALPPLRTTSMTLRVLIGVAYAWSVFLVLQSLQTVVAVPSLMRDLGSDDSWARFTTTVLMGSALLKVGLICAGIFAYKRWRSAATTAVYAGAVLYAFPVSRIVEGWMVGQLLRPDPSTLTSLDALCSYGAVFMIVLNYLHARPAPQVAAEPAT